MRRRATAMDLRVRLLSEPCLWCWEIVDRHRGDTLVRSSWTAEWMAYESREEALTAGRRRLSELVQRGVEGAPEGTDRQKGDMVLRWLA
jgi:hypothetical protein